MYEVFDSRTGNTMMFCRLEERAKEFSSKVPYMDYDPAPKGFYVVDMAGYVMQKRFDTRADADSEANWENMASDRNTYTVVEVN